MGSLESLVKQFVGSKSELLWIELRDIQGVPSSLNVESVPEGVVHKFVPLEYDTELNIEVQFLLGKMGFAQASSPFHLFFESTQGRLIFLSPSLEGDGLQKLVSDLLAWLWVEGKEARSEFLATVLECYKIDPLRTELPQSKVHGISEGAINPLLQSFDTATGCFGGDSYMSAPAGAYRALGFVESEGASLKELALVQSLKGPLWDQLSGLYYRFYDKKTAQVCPEKWLIPNLEMLVEIKDEAEKFKNTFLSECFYDGFKTLVEEFISENGVLYSGIAWSNSESQAFDSKDLLSALDHSQRHLAQEFYGLLGGSKKLPQIQTSLKELCAAQGLELTDTRLKLIEIRKNLRKFRNSRQGSETKYLVANDEQKSRVKALFIQLRPWIESQFKTQAYASLDEFLNSLDSAAGPHVVKTPLSLLEYSKSSKIHGAQRYSIADSEYAESKLAFDLRQVSLAERFRFFQSFGETFENYKVLGLKGMGWMSYYLEFAALAERYQPSKTLEPSIT
jgi:hypothetical protein